MVRPVLLVGSIGLHDATEVFETIGARLGSLVRRIPDGETGERHNWILWQSAVMARAEGIEVGGSRLTGGDMEFLMYRLKPGKTAADVKFGPLGYAEEARQSYAIFRRLRDAGRVPAGTRFQVSIPTPFDVVYGFCLPESVRTLWPVYERQMLTEIRDLVQSIPAEDLAIQWDMALEFHRVIEVPEMLRQYPMQELADSVARLCAEIPETIELGLHCCYGDPGHKHVVEPKDTANLVAFANTLAAAIRRSIAWVHMPVPKERDDDAYFAPLRGLHLKPETELYLGLIHLTDGVEGAKRRMTAAAKVAPSFGIATECGMGRRPPETMAQLIDLHRQVAESA